MIKTLLKSVREYKTASIQTPIFVAVEVILECFIPLVMADLIDDMTGETMSPVIKYGIALILMAACSFVFGQLSARTAAAASAGLAKNLRQDLFFKIQDFAFSDVDHFSTSSLVTRMTTDVTNIQNAYQMIIRIAIRTPLMIIFSVIMSLGINVSMAAIFLCLIPVLGIALALITGLTFPVFKRIFKKYDAMNNSVQENIAGIRVVKAFVREEYEKQKFKRAATEICNDFTRAEKILALNNPVMMFCIYMAFLLVSCFGARMIINTGATELTTGELSSLINYAVQILASMMMLSMVFVMTGMASESANRITEVLNYDSTLVSGDDKKNIVKDGSVDFDHVYLKYSKTSEKNALENIDLHIQSGMTVGIIGGTGSSKSSLVQLIPRLYDATEGTVRVGGINVQDYDLETLRNSVAMVLQKNVLFSGTIKDNLRWGNMEATDEEIIHACQQAQADEFINQFPDKYDTYIEQGGTNVSGGQKQRLCIARALLKKPKILILDDSTSAVDTKTDALIRKAFREELPETTKIIIAQRVSSVQDADLIIVMDQGKIVEQGKHDELLKYHGIYREVYDSQTRGKEAE